MDITNFPVINYTKWYWKNIMFNNIVKDLNEKLPPAHLSWSNLMNRFSSVYGILMT